MIAALAQWIQVPIIVASVLFQILLFVIDSLKLGKLKKRLAEICPNFKKISKCEIFLHGMWMNKMKEICYFLIIASSAETLPN